MVVRPLHMNPFEFVVVSALRAQQLVAGSVPRLNGDHAKTTVAQMEVADGLVARVPVEDAVSASQCRWQL